MDIYCPKCGEPVEIDSLHDYAEDAGSTFDQVLKTFKKDGCGVAFDDWGFTCVPDPSNAQRASMSSMLFDILGDDVDGIASTIQDWEYLNS
jgi:hypothetical protein